jgi:tetraacyldisaccharide 4'-kinase
MRDPAFWWRPAGVAAGLLSPLAAVYGFVAERRMARPGARAGVPVICIGNPTLGGAGKTPTAIAVAQLLQAAGRRPFVLSRGYGGSLAGPVPVDPATHRADDVGDEPLLLAGTVPTVVARDRVAGAAAAHGSGADVIVMDDGFQNPALAKDLAILVVDGRRALGNGRVFPAGPLRAPLDPQLHRAHALVVVGPGAAGDRIAAMAEGRRVPVFRAVLEPDRTVLGELEGRPVLAFAGIGDPEKFFATLRYAGIDIRVQRAFPDHHRYGRGEALDLVARAKRDKLVPVTTEKDFVRLAGQADLAALAGLVRTLPVRLKFSDTEAFRDLILRAAQ